MYLSVYLYVSRSLFLSVGSTYLSIYLSVYVSSNTSTCLSIYRSIYLSVYLSACLLIYLHVYLSLSLSLSLYIYMYMTFSLSLSLSLLLSCSLLTPVLFFRGLFSTAAWLWTPVPYSHRDPACRGHSLAIWHATSSSIMQAANGSYPGLIQKKYTICKYMYIYIYMYMQVCCRTLLRLPKSNLMPPTAHEGKLGSSSSSSSSSSSWAGPYSVGSHKHFFSSRTGAGNAPTVFPEHGVYAYRMFLRIPLPHEVLLISSEGGKTCCILL